MAGKEREAPDNQAILTSDSIPVCMTQKETPPFRAGRRSFDTIRVVRLSLNFGNFHFCKSLPGSNFSPIFAFGAVF
jgi:hypothetical protein